MGAHGVGGQRDGHGAAGRRERRIDGRADQAAQCCADRQRRDEYACMHAVLLAPVLASAGRLIN